MNVYLNNLTKEKVNKFIKDYSNKRYLKYHIDRFEDFTGVDNDGIETNGGNKVVTFNSVGGYEVEVMFWGFKNKDKNLLDDYDYFSAVSHMVDVDIIDGDIEFAKSIAKEVLIAGAKVAKYVGKDKRGNEKYVAQRYWVYNSKVLAKRALNIANS